VCVCVCACVLGPGNRRREGKTRERLCAWEPDLFCFWVHWGERESESEWYHDIVLVLFLMLHYDLASICGVALGLNALLWDFFHRLRLHWFRHSQSQSQSKLHFQSEWLTCVCGTTVQASSVGDSERVRGGTICPGSCSYAPPNHPVAVGAEW
jgi:hypothetical protein